MYNKILVAVDQSEFSQQALTQAVAIAKAFQAELHLVHVLSPLEQEYQATSLAFGVSAYSETLEEAIRERWQTSEEEGIEMLQSLCEEAKQAGVESEFTQTFGQPERKICEFAQNWNADLIVIGSHGRKGLNELFIGSVSNYVSHHVPCAVLIVHQQVKSNSKENSEQQTVNW